MEAKKEQPTAFHRVLDTSKRVSRILAQALTDLNGERIRAIRYRLCPGQSAGRDTIRIAAEEIPLICPSGGRCWRCCSSS